MMKVALFLALLGGATALRTQGRDLLNLRISHFDNNGEGEDSEPGLVANHLAKCGGRFVSDVLERAYKGDGLELQDEYASLNKKSAKKFTIGLVRNPFDYYVSLWAFTSGRDKNKNGIAKGLTESQKKVVFGKTKPYDSPEDIKSFHEFIKAVNSEKLGVMSLRFHGSYLRNFGHAKTQKGFQSMTARSGVVKKQTQGIVEDLAAFNKQETPVNCWVHTENLEMDLRGCLEMYEMGGDAKVGDAKGQSRKGKIDWQEFDAALKESKHNKVDHAPCSTFYDTETTALVKQSDKYILKNFNYPDHCSK